ncbi:MAG TPA: hypothetical protein VFE50_26140 [Cyclobacteriaceae bacterium]|nr:hypothetical protein [Cyclobacteriaceae bacterium]
MRKLAITVTLLVVCAGAYAQEKANYWVVETNKENPGKTVVRIYDAENNLVDESNVDRKIDIKSKKERKMLNRMARQNTPSANTIAYSKKKKNSIEE